MGECTVDNCKNYSYALGYCKRHWRQFHIYGKILPAAKRDPNEIKSDGDIAYIFLYNYKGIKIAEAIIDNSDVDLIKNIKWSCDSKNYVRNDRLGSLHRYLLKPARGEKVDHINCCPLDNRRSNLRICTTKENSWNQRGRSISGYKGVYKNGDVFQVSICKDGKVYNLGRFKCKKAAAYAYNQAAIKYFGEFALLNVIEYNQEASYVKFERVTNNDLL